MVQQLDMTGHISPMWKNWAKTYKKGSLMRKTRGWIWSMESLLSQINRARVTLRMACSWSVFLKKEDIGDGAGHFVGF